MKQDQFTRRTFLRHACCGTLGLAGSLALQPALAAEGKKTTLTPDQALAKLKKGNADSLAEKVKALPRGHERRMEIALSQAPFAVLVGCSDSRVPPELLFGARLGELFIVRNAGNTQHRRQPGGCQSWMLDCRVLPRAKVSAARGLLQLTQRFGEHQVVG